jgi:hypothetical protein
MHSRNVRRERFQSGGFLHVDIMYHHVNQRSIRAMTSGDVPFSARQVARPVPQNPCAQLQRYVAGATSRRDGDYEIKDLTIRKSRVEKNRSQILEIRIEKEGLGFGRRLAPGIMIKFVAFVEPAQPPVGRDFDAAFPVHRSLDPPGPRVLSHATQRDRKSDSYIAAVSR